MDKNVQAATGLLEIFGIEGIHYLNIIFSVLFIIYGIACLKSQKFLFSKYQNFSNLSINIISIITIIIGMIILLSSLKII